MFMFIKKMKKSFGYAISGIVFFWQERNIKVHISVASFVLGAGFYFNIKPSEWIAIVFAISLVLSMEILNTVMEEMIDFSCTIKNGHVMKIKDLSAGAVLVSAIGAVAVGLIIFWPYFLVKLQ